MDTFSKTDSDWEDEDPEEIQPAPRKSRMKWKHSRLYRTKSRRVVNRSAEEQKKSTNWMITLMMGLTYAISQTFKLVNNSLQQRVLWTILFIILSKSM